MERDYAAITDKVRKFTINREVEDRISSDSVFAEFFRIVETTVRRFAQFSGLTWEFKASTRTDVETPWWTRIVLLIKPLDTEFEKSIDLWDQIDAEVRKAVELTSAEAHPSISERIKELNKNFFIEMDLG